MQLTISNEETNMLAKATQNEDNKPLMGNTVKDFSLPATGAGTFTLPDFKGKALVLYFYPKDNTPGCTTEGMNFRDLHNEFRKSGAEVYGISRDSLKSHENFQSQAGLPV